MAWISLLDLTALVCSTLSDILENREIRASPPFYFALATIEWDRTLGTFFWITILLFDSHDELGRNPFDRDIRESKLSGRICPHTASADSPVLFSCATSDASRHELSTYIVVGWKLFCPFPGDSICSFSDRFDTPGEYPNMVWCSPGSLSHRSDRLASGLKGALRDESTHLVLRVSPLFLL